MRTRLTAVMVIAALLIPGVVAAQDRVTDRTTDEPAVTDQVGETTTHRGVVRPSDKMTDRPSDRITDRSRDRVTDRCARVDFVRDVCCPDRSTDEVTDRCQNHLNLRGLIWRLIKAHEWEKLFQLLRRLHIQ